MLIHNLACNQQMSVNDDKQYTERSTTAMCIHNLACKQATPTMINGKQSPTGQGLVTKHKLMSHKASYL